MMLGDGLESVRVGDGDGLEVPDGGPYSIRLLEPGGRERVLASSRTDVLYADWVDQGRTVAIDRAGPHGPGHPTLLDLTTGSRHPVRCPIVDEDYTLDGRYVVGDTDLGGQIVRCALDGTEPPRVLGSGNYPQVVQPDSFGLGP